MVIQQGKKLAGRPITLEIDNHRLITRADYKILQTWADVFSLEMTLTHPDGRVFNVRFRNHEKAIDCRPVFHQIPETDSDKFIGTINFLTL